MKGYKVTDSSRSRIFGIASDSLSNLRAKGSAKLGIREDVYLALDDGTIVDDEDYFNAIPSQTIIIFYRKTESVVTGADYILNVLRKINAGYLTAGERAGEFISDKMRDLIKCHLLEERMVGNKWNTRDEDPDWFADLDTGTDTKEDYMFRRSQDRIRGYFYKFYGDARKNPVFLKEAEPRKELGKCVDYFRSKLKEDKYFGCYFDRRCARAHRDEADSSKPSGPKGPKRWKGEDEEIDPGLPIYDSYCDNEGRFVCQGKWDSEECEFHSKHVINPYSDRESRILFSTWNFDHRIEKSRSILPTLFDAIRNRRDGLLVNYEYFYKLLFTNFNLKLVHVVCHDKTVHDLSCDARYIYVR